MVRGLLVAMALLGTSGCALFQPVGQTYAGQDGRVTLQGVGRADRRYFVDPQVTVYDAAPVSAPKTRPMGPGAKLYAQNCAACHGSDARGNGWRSTSRDMVSPDLTRLSSRAGGAFPTERVMRVMHANETAYHRRILPNPAGSVDNAWVEWVAPNGQMVMTPRGTLDMVAYLESLQL